MSRPVLLLLVAAGTLLGLAAEWVALVRGRAPPLDTGPGCWMVLHRVRHRGPVAAAKQRNRAAHGGCGLHLVPREISHRSTCHRLPGWPPTPCTSTAGRSSIACFRTPPVGCPRVWTGTVVAIAYVSVILMPIAREGDCHGHPRRAVGRRRRSRLRQRASAPPGGHDVGAAGKRRWPSGLPSPGVPWPD